MSDGEQNLLIQEWVQLAHNLKMSNGPLSHDGHLLFKQELQIQEDPSVVDWVCLGQRNPIQYQR